MNNKIRRLLAMFALMLLWVAPHSLAAENGEPSDALGILCAQLEAAFLKPMGEQWAGYPRRDPESFAALLGATLQSQELYLNEQPEYEQQFETVRDEAVLGLHQLAEALGNRNPKSGAELSGTALELNFYRGLNGYYNQSIEDSLGINPAELGLKMMLHEVDVGQAPAVSSPDPGGSRSRDSIRLLGQEPDYPEAGGIICPPHNSDPFLKLDTNDNPGDGTYADCQYFEDGRLYKQTPYENGELNGHDVAYTQDENFYYISYDYPYVNGKRHGDGRQWSTTRPYGGDVPPYLSVVFPHRNGKPHGVEEQFTVMANGQRVRKSRTTYVNGKREGISESWGFTNRQWGNVPPNTVYKMVVRSYKNGKLHGTETWYDPDGSVDRVNTYRAGQRIN